MTREEAAKILKGAIKKPNTEDGYLGQAITMAIRSLEAWDEQVLVFMVNGFQEEKLHVK